MAAEEPEPQEPKVEEEPEPEEDADGPAEDADGPPEDADGPAEDADGPPEDFRPSTDNTVVFMIGRMNPPTPGHGVIAQQVLKIAKEKGAIPRIYLTRSQNNPDKIADKVAFVTKNPGDQVPTRRRRKRSRDDDDGDVEETVPVYVKNKAVQNPLTPEQKKEFLIDMLVFKKKQEHQKNKHDFDADRYKGWLDGVVNIHDDCVGRGPYTAFTCVAKVQKGMEEKWTEGVQFPTNIDVSKLIYVMGGEVESAEAENREKNCGCNIDEVETCQGKLDWKNRKFPCKIIPRAKDSEGAAAEDQGAAAEGEYEGAAEGEYEGAAAEDTEEDQFIIDIPKMSGSVVRLMVACNPIYREEQLAKFQQVYKEYLEPERIQELYDAILGGIICTKQPLPKRRKTAKTGGKKKRKTLKKKKHGKKKIGSKKGKSIGKSKRKRKTKRLRKGKKLLKPGVRKRHSTRRKR